MTPAPDGVRTRAKLQGGAAVQTIRTPNRARIASRLAPQVAAALAGRGSR